MSNRTVLLTTLVLFVAMELVFIAVPDRLAGNAGYDGAMKMFALDMNVPALTQYRAPFAMIQSYGDIGRQQVVVSHVLFDFVFPAIYVVFFISLFRLLGRLPESSARRSSRIGIAVAATAGLADWAENLAIIAMASAFPNRLGWIEQLTTPFTLLKWLAFVAAVALVIVTAWHRYRPNSQVSS